jgi:hypothetical protein
MDSKHKLRTKVGEIAGNIENTAVSPEDHSSDPFVMLEIFAGTARVTAACRDIGLSTGPPVDINTGFDLLTEEGQQATWELIKSGQPLVIFMAPVCTAWSSLSNTRPEAERIKRRAEAYPMVEFCSEIAQYQQRAGKYFIIENPETSQMWNTPPMMAVADEEDVNRSTVHMCA